MSKLNDFFKKNIKIGIIVNSIIIASSNPIMAQDNRNIVNIEGIGTIDSDEKMLDELLIRYNDLNEQLKKFEKEHDSCFILSSVIYDKVDSIKHDLKDKKENHIEKIKYLKLFAKKTIEDIFSYKENIDLSNYNKFLEKRKNNVVYVPPEWGNAFFDDSKEISVISNKENLDHVINILNLKLKEIEKAKNNMISCQNSVDNIIQNLEKMLNENKFSRLNRKLNLINEDLDKVEIPLYELKQYGAEEESVEEIGQNI